MAYSQFLVALNIVKELAILVWWLLKIQNQTKLCIYFMKPKHLEPLKATVKKERICIQQIFT